MPRQTSTSSKSPSLLIDQPRLLTGEQVAQALGLDLPGWELLVRHMQLDDLEIRVPCPGGVGGRWCLDVVREKVRACGRGQA